MSRRKEARFKAMGTGCPSVRSEVATVVALKCEVGKKEIENKKNSFQEK